MHLKFCLQILSIVNLKYIMHIIYTLNLHMHSVISLFVILFDRSWLVLFNKKELWKSIKANSSYYSFLILYIPRMRSVNIYFDIIW